MSRLRVLQLLHSLDLGGAEKMAVSLADVLGRRHDFVYFCLDRAGPLAERLRAMDVPTHVGARSGSIDRKLATVIRDLCDTERIDLIHAHQYTPFFYALLSRRFGSSPPILFTEHGRFHPDRRDLRRVVLNRLLMRRSDRVAAVGRSVARAVRENEGIPAKRIEVVYNGVDLSRFLSPSPTTTQARQALDLDADEFLVLMCARLDPIKDHFTALDALVRAGDALDRARLLIVGGGPERQVIRQRIETLGLSGRVTLAGERRDVDLWMKAADALILTSVSEGIPLVLIEGMASGLPIVATAVGGVPEVVRDGREGLLRPVGDAEGIANALVEIADSPDRGARLGERGRERAIERFSLAGMAEAYDRLYERLAGDPLASS